MRIIKKKAIEEKDSKIILIRKGEGAGDFITGDKQRAYLKKRLEADKEISLISQFDPLVLVVSLDSLEKPEGHRLEGARKLGFDVHPMLQDQGIESVVVINEGVEVSGAMVEQCFELLRTTLRAPFCLLVDECNSHSYDFQAQTALGAIDDLLAVALVCERPPMEMAACCLMRLPRPTHWPMAVFSNRDDAMEMLEALQGVVGIRTPIVEKFPQDLRIG